jgi:riboflavin kinase/FMN adenylyltransferase
MTPTAIALGNFDGVHLGHQAVIGQVLPSGVVDSSEPISSGCKVAHPSPTVSRVKGYSHWNLASRADRKGQGDDVEHSGSVMPTVVTFFPHPQEFFSGQSRPLLTPLEEKAAQISRLGIGQLVLLPFNRDLAALSPEEFVDILLIQQLKAQHISVGKDFCFGKNRAGTVDDLKRLAGRHGVEVSLAPLRLQGTERISSSRIREALLEGNLDTAQALLGRPYSICGRVVKGQQLGRTLGFPTANVKPPADKFLPKHGVYSVWVQGISGTPEQFLPGVLNIGVRPTVNGLATTVEVHLLKWSGNLYGKSLGLVLHEYLRPEQKFASLDVLKDQIQQDCQAALASLAKPY